MQPRFTPKWNEKKGQACRRWRRYGVLLVTVSASIDDNSTAAVKASKAELERMKLITKEADKELQNVERRLLELESQQRARPSWKFFYSRCMFILGLTPLQLQPPRLTTIQVDRT